MGEGAVADLVPGLPEVEERVSRLQLALGAEGGLGPGLPQGPDVAGGDVGVGCGLTVTEASGFPAPGDVVDDGGQVQRAQSQSSGVDFGPLYPSGAGGARACCHLLVRGRPVHRCFPGLSRVKRGVEHLPVQQFVPPSANVARIRSCESRRVRLKSGISDPPQFHTRLGFDA